MGDEPPFNDYKLAAAWAGGLGFKGLQIPTWDANAIDLDQAAMESALSAGDWEAALSDARVTRVAIRLGLIDWDQAAEAWASEQAAADWLTAEGLLDPFRAMEVFAEANTLQRQNELRTERSQLLRLWSDLVADGSSGVNVQAITQFVLAVVLGGLLPVVPALRARALAPRAAPRATPPP